MYFCNVRQWLYEISNLESGNIPSKISLLMDQSKLVSAFDGYKDITFQRITILQINNVKLQKSTK